MRMFRSMLAGFAACSCVLLGVGGARADNTVTPQLAASACPAGSGTFRSLTITGFCSIPAGSTVNILGNLTIAPNAVLDAAFQAPTVNVSGNILVLRGGALILGCSPEELGCPAVTNDRINGSIVAIQALAVILHFDTIGGHVLIQGGGGGLTCAPNAALQGSPAYSDVEDSTISGNAAVFGLQSCWFGFIRNHVTGNVVLSSNRFADPDAMEPVTNTIGGNLACFNNSPPAHFGDSGGSPNTVGGLKLGECASL